MSERQRSIGRLIALRETLQAIAAARLAGAEAAKADVIDKREAVFAFLDGTALAGPLATLALKRVRSLAAQETQAEARRQVLAKARQTAETKLKLAQRVGEPIARAEREADERRDLEALIEAAVAWEIATGQP